MLHNNIHQVIKEINEACFEIGRNPSEITLMGASKSQSIRNIEDAYNNGVVHFGENYLQEAEKKINAIDKDIIWHFIGAIQSRKTKKIAQLFDWVHTVDSLKVAQRLDNERPTSKGKLNICIQVNIDKEASKSGVNENELSFLLEELVKLEKIQVRGLMIIPKPRSSKEEQIAVFNRLRNILESHKNNFSDLDTLSMGMSSDYLSAIKEGATILRIGTGIFGERA